MNGKVNQQWSGLLARTVLENQRGETMSYCSSCGRVFEEKKEKEEKKEEKIESIVEDVDF